MRETFQLPEEARLRGVLNTKDRSAESALKNFRYVVSSVNGEAQQVWADLWNELREGVTPGGMVLPQMSKGFVPPGGWPEFLEKMWLLKHYLDYIHRFCDASSSS